MKPRRLEHGYLGKYAKIEATDTCRECSGKLDEPVPHHYDFHQTCESCWTALALRPKTPEETAAAERWEAWLKAKFPPDGVMVRRKVSPQTTTSASSGEPPTGRP